MSFWTKTTTTTAAPSSNSKIAQYQAEAQKANEEAKKVGSFWGIVKNTFTGAPAAAKTLANKVADTERYKAITTSPLALAIQGKFKEVPSALKSSFWGVSQDIAKDPMAFALNFAPGGEAAGKGIVRKEGSAVASEAEALLQQIRGRQVQEVSVPRDISGPQLQKGKFPQQPLSIGQAQSPNLSYTAKVPSDFNVDKYVSEQLKNRELARKSEKGSLISKTKDFFGELKAKLVDSTAPIEDILNKNVKSNKINLLPEQDIHNQIDRVLRAPTIAGQFARDGGMVDVIRKVDSLKNLDQYLIAKHAIELEARGIKTGRNITKDGALVDTLFDKYEPFAKTISEYSQKLLDYSAESGLISKDLASTLKSRYPDYVPFQRVFNELEKSQGFGTNAVASLSKQNIIQKIEGSSREIESPIESLLGKTNDAFRQGEKNVAGRMLAEYEKLPGNPFSLRELKPGDTAPHTISFLEDGVKRTFETTKEIADAAKSLNVQQLNILGQIFAFPTRIARLGITGINLPFVGANIAKDQVTAFINSNYGLRTSVANPVNFLRSLFSVLKHDDLYQEMVRAGGAGTSFDISRNQVNQTVSRIRSGRNAISKIKYTVTHPQELLRIVEDIIGRSEEFTRMQQYRGTKKALLGKGLNEKNAVIGGARAARDSTVNFARRGEWGTVLNSAFLYLNASIQGTRTLLTNLKTKPITTGAKIAVSALFPMAVVTTWNLSDPERKKAYEDIPDYEKENNIIIIPPNPTQDENGKWNVIKIPLSQEINSIVGAVRRPIESAHGLDPLKFKDFAKSLIGTVSPISPTAGSLLSTLTPQAVKPSIEAATNKNLFTGYPQVSQGLENLSPENQIKADTSKFAINWGKRLGVSPIKIDAFIKGTFGGVGSQLTGQQNVKDAVIARFGKAAGGEVDNRTYKELQDKAREKADYKSKVIRPIYNHVQDLLKEGREEEAIEITDALSPEDYNLYKDIKTAEKSKATQQAEREMYPTAKRVKELVDAGRIDEATEITTNMTEEEYRIYQLVKKKL